MQPFRLTEYLKRKLYLPLLGLLQQGITPRKLAVTAALGAVLGVMPAVGVVTIITTFLALRLRLNAPLMIGITYLMSPLYVFLYVPFIRLGLWVFNVSDFELSFNQILEMFREDWLKALRHIWFANLLGLLAWLLLSAPVFGLLYAVLLPLFRKIAQSEETK